MPDEEPKLPLENAAPKNEGLRPLSADGTGEAAPVLSRPAEIDDVVESFLAEHPEEPQAEEAPAVEDAPPAVEAKPAVEAEAKPADGETPPAVEEKPATPVVAEKPAVAEVPAEPVKPAAPSYAPEDKFALFANPDGTPNEWNRAQIVAALRERVDLKPKAEEAASFQETFGMNASEAKEYWAPSLQRLASSKPLARFIEQVMLDQDAGVVGYLVECLDHYTGERAAGHVTPQFPERDPQRAAIDPEVKRELDESRAFRQRTLQQEATNRLNSEIGEAVRRYPFLATDNALMGELMVTAETMWLTDERAGVAEDKRRGLPDAVRAKSSIYDALLIARAPQPAAEPVPAVPVLGSNGASPTGTQRQPDNRPKMYKDLSDAVEDHLREYPA